MSMPRTCYKQKRLQVVCAVGWVVKVKSLLFQNDSINVCGTHSDERKKIFFPAESDLSSQRPNKLKHQNCSFVKVYGFAAFVGIWVLPRGERLLPQPRLHPLVQEPRIIRGHSPPATDPSRILQLQHLQTDQSKVGQCALRSHSCAKIYQKVALSASPDAFQ